MLARLGRLQGRLGGLRADLLRVEIICRTGVGEMQRMLTGRSCDDSADALPAQQKRLHAFERVRHTLFAQHCFLTSVVVWVQVLLAHPAFGPSIPCALPSWARVAVSRRFAQPLDCPRALPYWWSHWSGRQYASRCRVCSRGKVPAQRSEDGS